MIEKPARYVNGDVTWYPHMDRFKNVVLKIAVEHVYYKLAERKGEQPKIHDFFH